MYLGENLKNNKSEYGENEIVEKYEPLVRNIAAEILRRNNRSRHFELDELMQAGREGAMKAIRLYDKSKSNGTRLRSFAYCKIRGAILDYMRDNSPASRVDAEMIRNYKAAEKELTNKLGRKPTHSEIAEELGVGMKKYLEYITALCKSNPLSTDTNNLALNGNGYGGKFNREIALSYDYEYKLDKKKLKEKIERALDYLNLTPKQKKVVNLYFFEEIPQREIAKIMGVSESRVSHIISNIKRKLRGLGKEIINDDDLFLTRYFKDYL